MIDSTTVELVTAIIVAIVAGGGSLGVRSYYFRNNGSKEQSRVDKIDGRMDKINGRMDASDAENSIFLTEDKFITAREACRKEVLKKLENLDLVLRGDGKINGDPGIVSSIQHIGTVQKTMMETIEEIRTHQKNGHG